jgi:hypothetical protein
MVGIPNAELVPKGLADTLRALMDEDDLQKKAAK